MPVAEISRKAGISLATYFKWRKKYACLLLDEMRRLKALEDENARLKKIVADSPISVYCIQDRNKSLNKVSPAASDLVHFIDKTDSRRVWSQGVE